MISLGKMAEKYRDAIYRFNSMNGNETETFMKYIG